ncbi:mediator of RNA polymerase II transcription subunit 18-like [Oppia nitens]|uniref:mediator of RNA polymerase II transcription subunit 18-like n=1 Tax=Oppia nitens TaxID=1686743 RepID=UPI0023DA15FC|nr:mediator of RNA polymerase II transcription subunit 18-like [Oppia nitens]
MESMTNTSGRRSGTGLGQQHEYLLSGSILDDSCEQLLHKLRGFCDNCDSSAEPFQDHEMVFTIRAPNGTNTSLRVRKSLDVPNNPYHLRYLGQQELGDKNRATIVRNCIDCSTSSDCVQFLQEMGFKLDYEFVLKGYMFRKGRMKVIVAKLFKTQPHVGPDALEAISRSYLVELSVNAPAGQEGIADEMKAFSDSLKPLVILDKVDTRRLQSV